jgi:N-acetylmuramic acid 6-phosphate etherase
VVRLDAHHAIGGIEFKSDSFDLNLKTRLIRDPLHEQLLIKLILNSLSLLVMGQLDRYEGNVMTWVRASNGKLIDRACRYLEQLIERRNMTPLPRAELVKLIFETQKSIRSDEPLVLEVLRQLNELHSKHRI